MLNVQQLLCNVDILSTFFLIMKGYDLMCAYYILVRNYDCFNNPPQQCYKVYVGPIRRNLDHDYTAFVVDRNSSSDC